MDRTSRRRFLRTGCGAGTFAVAGCLGGPTNAAGDPDTYEIVQYATALGRPEWREGERAGYLDAFTSEDGARNALEFGELPDDRREEVEAFVAGTEFEETVLLYVASVGPDTCHDAIEVRELAMEAATLTGEAAAVDTSDGDVDCGAAETHPSALIRPEFDERPERVEMRVVDGWDGRETIERVVE